MAPLHFEALAAATILLFVVVTFPAASALVPGFSIRQIQSVRNNNVRKTTRAPTRLSLGMDPTDMAQHAQLLHHHATADPTSTLDMLSSFTLAKASVVPNQSLSPLAETIQSTAEAQGGSNLLEAIPDLQSMPGGAPRSGNAFLSGSFRDLYDAVIVPTVPQNYNAGPDGSIVVPAREMDVVARYADLMSRIPLAAAVYALVDFFLINAEEDLAIAEFYDEESEVEAMMEVESRVMVQRFVGLFAVVAVTVTWSYLAYHPVPFGEL